MFASHSGTVRLVIKSRLVMDCKGMNGIESHYNPILSSSSTVWQTTGLWQVADSDALRESAVEACMRLPHEVFMCCVGDLFH